MTLPKGHAGNLAGIPYCPEDAHRGCGGEQRCGRAGEPELLECQPDRHRLDDERHRGQAADARRQGLPGRPVQGRPALAGDGHAGVWRARSTSAPSVVRVALNRRTRKPLRSTRSPTRSPTCTAESSWTSARSTSTSIARSSCSTRPTAPRRRPPASINGGGADPTNPAAWSSYAVNVAVPGDRLQQARLQAEAAHPPVRREEHDHPRQAPEAAGDPGSQAKATPTCCARPWRCRTRCSSTRATSAPSARGRSWPRGTCPKAADLRPRGSEEPAAGQDAEGAGVPGLLQPRIARPARRPARPGEHPAARRDQLQERRDQDRVQQDAGRSGEASSSSAWKAARRRASWSTPRTSARASCPRC